MKRINRYTVLFIALLLIFPCMAAPSVFAEGNETRAIDFTETELACIRQSKTEPITVGIIPNLFPMSDYDQESGEFSGIILEMLERIENHTGLVFECQRIELEREMPITSLKEKDTRLVAGVLQTQNFIDDKELLLSDALFDGSMVFAGRKGENFIEDGENKTIAIINGFQVAVEYVEKNFQGYEILFCETAEECLDAVARGDANATLHNKYGLGYLLQNPHYANLEMIQAFSLSLSHRIAGLAEEGDVLISVINKGLDSISDEEYNYVLMNYTIGNAYEMTIADVIYKYRMPFTVIAVLLLIIFSGIISIIIILQKNTVKLRTAYGQTKEALTAAQHAGDAKGQFTSRMSHEIRTPLNAVIGYIAIAKDSIENQKKVYDCIIKSELAAKHLLSVINDVLDMSSIENGKTKIAHSEFDLKQLISNTTEIFCSQAKQKGITFEVFLPNITEERIIGDGLKLSQILINLLSNAIKFTPKGGSIRFTAERLITQKGKAYFRFVVADTGMGIAKEFMAGLFTAYAQEDVSIAQNYGGSGLGLAITKNLVTMMDGTIHAESEKGKGTVFTVELPFEIIESLITVDDKGDCDQEKLRDRGCFKGKRLLLAEDNEMNLEIATDILTTAGFMVETANNGRLAVEKFTSCEAEYYDAILMDVQMPELNGYEATRAIRASCHAEAKNIPIIAMTANAFAEDVASALASGMNDHIAKPIDLDQLYSVMRKYMEGGGPK